MAYEEEALRLLDEDEALRKKLDEFDAAFASETDALEAKVNPPRRVSPWSAARSQIDKTVSDYEESQKRKGPLETVLGAPETGGDLQSLVTGEEADLPWTTDLKNAVVKTERAVGRGVRKAFDGIEDTAAGLAVGAYKTSQAYRIGRDPAAEEEFLKWYEKPVREWDGGGLTSRVEMEKLLPPESEGVYGFVEGISQFATGWRAAGPMISALGSAPVVGGLAQTLGKTRLLKGAAQGLAVDVAAFDPYEKRLSSFVADGPEWFGQPALQFLAAPLAPNENDGEIRARLKAALEGYLTGMTAEVVLFGLRKLRIKNLFQRGEIDEKQATEALERIEAEGVAEVADGPAKVTKSDDGLHSVEVEDAVEAAPAKPFQGLIDEAKAAEAPKVTEAPKAPKVIESTHASAGKAEVEAAAFNHATKNIKAADDLLVDEGSREAFAKAFKAYQQNGDPRSVADLLDTYGFNASYIQEPKRAVMALKSLVDTLPEAAEAARARPKTFDEIKAEAVKLFPHMTDDGALKVAADMFGGVDRLPEKLAATRAWMWWQARQVSKLTRLVDADPTNAKLVDQQMAALDTLFKLHSFVSGSTTRTAQTLASLQMGQVSELVSKAGVAAKAADDAVEAGVTKEASGTKAPAATKADDPKAAAQKQVDGAVKEGKLTHRAPGTYDIAKGMSREEIQALGRLIAMADGNLEGMLALMAGPKHADIVGSAVPASVKKSWMSYVNTYRTEALLSAPVTHVGNIVSNLGVAVKRPLQFYWAGVESGDKALRDEGADMLGGLAVHWAESMKAATQAFKQGRNIFDPVSKVGETIDDILPLEAAALQNGSLPGNLAQVLFRMPSRMLMSADEFFKHLNGRAFTRAQVFKQARAEGITDTSVMAQRARDAMKVAFHPEYGAVYPDAMKYAKEATFTDDLPKKAEEWQKAIHNTEFGRFVVPFYRTPANIFLHAWEEAPGLNLLNKKMAEDLEAGGARAAVARAKADFGAALWGLGAWMALSGKITGAGPSDPELRKQWLAAGNQPYSWVIGEGESAIQVSYRRGDPFTTAFGMVADIVSMSGELDENKKLSSAAVVTTVFANNVTNKTFMAGLSDFLDAVASGNVKDSQSFLRNAAGSFVPNVLVRGNTDDTVREARSVVDGIIGRVPGVSESIEPRRNIFGEKVMKAPGWANRFFNPFTIMDKPKDADAAVQLYEIGKAMPMPDTKWGAIDMTDRELFGPDRNGQSPYDRMLEMLAAPPWGGPPLRKVVEHTLKNSGVQEAADSSMYAPGGLKYTLVSKPIQAYQTAARQYLLKEYPSLLEAVKQQSHAEAAAIAGGSAAAQDVLSGYEKLFVPQP